MTHSPDVFNAITKGPNMLSLPYFTENGSIVLSKKNDIFRVSVPWKDHDRETLTVEIYDDAGWHTDHPARWLHTEEDAEEVDKLAKDALHEYYAANIRQETELDSDRPY